MKKQNMYFCVFTFVITAALIVFTGCDTPGSGGSSKNVPTIPASGISFTDTDQDEDEIGGDIVITAASDESNITHYVLYWGINSTKNGLIEEIPVTGSNITNTIAQDTSFGANTHFLVFTKNADGEMSTGVSVEIDDTVGPPPVNPANGVSFTDTDSEPDEIGGTVTITRATDESDITHYILYWGTNATTTSGSAITQIATTGSDVTYPISANTDIGSNTHFIVRTRNANGEMTTGVSCEIDDYALPQNQASGVSFTDVDGDTGEIGGTVTITRAFDESDITHYMLYWGINSTTKNGLIAEIAKTGSNVTYAIPQNTDPGTNTHLLVFTQNADGEMAAGISTTITDYIGAPPLTTAQSVSFTDTDPVEDEYGGTVTITAAADETYITHYVLYWGTNSTTINGPAINTIAATGSNVTYTLAQNTDIGSNTHFIVRTRNSYGEMTSGVSCAITDVNSKLFYAQDTTDSSYYSLTARFRAEGTYCKVYVENAELATVSKATAEAIASEFDSNIYTPITNAFGSTSDVDGDGKITILILDIVDSYNPPTNTGYVAGYYTAYNLYSLPNSNECDMIYVDCNPGDPTAAYETIAHELQHLICYYQKVLIQGNSSNFDTWINEGLSAGAEYVYSNTISASRINYYNADPSDYIAFGLHFITWINRLENYSTVYLFFQWLRIHAGTTNIYGAIINETNTDYQAVVTAVNDYFSAYTTADWNTIFRDWLIANALMDGAGLYGYNGNISALTLHGVTATDMQADLYPGFGIYVAITGPEAMTSGTNINYVGINTATSAVDFTSPYGGNYLLAYNTNADPDGSPETTGLLPKVEFIMSLSQQMLKDNAAANLPDKYPIGVVFGDDGKPEIMRKPIFIPGIK